MKIIIAIIIFICFLFIIRKIKALKMKIIISILGAFLIISTLFFAEFFYQEKNYETENTLKTKIKVSSNLINYNIPAKGIIYEIKKYSDSQFQNNILSYSFNPTIPEYTNLNNESADKDEILYSGNSPDYFEADTGYYEIKQKTNINYESLGNIKFYLDYEGKISIMDFDRDIFLDKKDLLKIKKEITQKSFREESEENIYFFNFVVSPRHNLIIHNVSDIFSEAVKTPQDYEYREHVTSFNVSYYDEIEQIWTKLTDKNKGFYSEIAEYGGGKRKDLSSGEDIDYFYKYNWNLPLVESTKYKVETRNMHRDYKKTSSNENAPSFTFFFNTNENFEILDLKMDNDTEKYYGQKYRDKFFTTSNELKINLFTQTKKTASISVEKENFFKEIFTLNIKNDFLLNSKQNEIKKNSTFSFSNKNNNEHSFVLKKY